MFSTNLQKIFIKYRILNQNNAFRYFRSIVRRGNGPKVIQGRIETVTKYDELENIQTYKDLVKSVQKSKLGDELELERNFLDEDHHGHVFEKWEMYEDMHKNEEKSLKSQIKKKIIGRKYCKFDKETNLLTHAAKQQIRFLYSSNPLEWNCKALSECFPISAAGVKKLLKRNYVLTCAEKIKAHDEDVARRWEILKSGKYSDEISILTYKLYKEGKLVDDYCSGNPNLPTTPPEVKKVIELKKKEPIGEFSAIVKSYHNYENKKLLEPKESDDKEVSIRDAKLTKNNHIKNALKFKIASEEYDDIDPNPEVYPNFKKKSLDSGEIPFSQFKEILREESEVKLNSKYKSEYDNFVQREISRSNEDLVSEKSEKHQNCFMKISKYRKENVDLMYEKGKKSNRVYKYDEKLGYQHPAGKAIKGKIKISPEYYKKGKLIKMGKTIYDEDGEFLCRVPT